MSETTPETEAAGSAEQVERTGRAPVDTVRRLLDAGPAAAAVCRPPRAPGAGESGEPGEPDGSCGSTREGARPDAA